MKWAKDIPLTQSDAWALCPEKLDEPYSCANIILAAEVERLRCELGHAQDQLERIRTLCLGSGVGLRDDVLDVLGRTGEDEEGVHRGMPYPGSAQDMMEDMAALAGAVVRTRPK